MRMLRIVPMICLMVFCAFQFAAAEPKGTLRVGLSTMPNALELAIAAERNAVNAALQIYDSLVWVNEEGTVVPSLAERWEISEDGTTYTFHLRRGVTFHNGEPFTADAVVYSWKRGTRDEMPYKDRYKVAHDVTKVDDYTVKISTGKDPNPLLVRYLANDWGIIPPKYHSEVGEAEFLSHPVGTGPFVFKEWKKGDRIVYEA
ncbi:MAG: ABC transporter substrate-binding protein, partial [Desulfobacterales bacterium]|nr:ABC transporter substrate-binding protein [Desulfobacterales bacterium]